MTEDELKAIERRMQGEMWADNSAHRRESLGRDGLKLIAEIRRLREAIKPVVAPEVWCDGFAKRADGVTVAMVPEPLYRALQGAYGEEE